MELFLKIFWKVVMAILIVIMYCILQGFKQIAGILSAVALALVVIGFIVQSRNKSN